MILSSYRKDKRLWKVAYTDDVTGLPNSLYLKEVLEDKLLRMRNTNFAVLMVNLTDLKTINMILGYETGDRMVKEISERLETLAKNGLTLYRFAADRFVFLYEGCRNRHDSRAIAMRIDDLFVKPFRLNESFKYMSVQVGISDTDGAQKSADQLLKEASVSLGSIKDVEDSSLAFFDSYMENELQREEAIEEELSKLLQGEGDGRFYLMFQPMVSMEDDRITGFEALARFESKALGLVMPMEFIRIAERKQIICQLGEVIFREACSFLRELKTIGQDEIKVAVNVSGVQLMRDCFSEGVRDIIERCGADPSMIELEITESILVSDFEEINERLRLLRNQGIRIHLDDFGTGYSSLHRLKELQVDTLKIDRSFISSIDDSGEEDSIVRDIISMAHRIGLVAIAEGVETKSQKDYLKSNGCDIYQGYLMSPPLEKHKAIDLLMQINSGPELTDENQTA
nr:bifunctional diguanylate cyclase/phosphodiesterase [Youngiibacter multivorans]